MTDTTPAQGIPAAARLSLERRESLARHLAAWLMDTGWVEEHLDKRALRDNVQFALANWALSNQEQGGDA